MVQIPDDPILHKLERTGHLKHPVGPICPICCAECDFVYKDAYHEILGCNECLTAYDADSEEECFPWRDE